MVPSGQGSPCLDLRRVSDTLADATVGTDLVIIEGMGRAIHTNLRCMNASAPWPCSNPVCRQTHTAGLAALPLSVLCARPRCAEVRKAHQHLMLSCAITNPHPGHNAVRAVLHLLATGADVLLCTLQELLQDTCPAQA